MHYENRTLLERILRMTDDWLDDGAITPTPDPAPIPVTEPIGTVVLFPHRQEHIGD